MREIKARRKKPECLSGYHVETRRHYARHLHLAYNKFLERPYEVVEKTCHEPPDWSLVEKILEDVKKASKHETAVYVFARPWLSYSQRAVQTGHVIAEFIAKYYGDPIVQNWIKNDKTLIVLKHPGYHKHLRDGPRHTIFVDRDISQYQSTAECCGPIKRDKAREMFGDLDLL